MHTPVKDSFTKKSVSIFQIQSNMPYMSFPGNIEVWSLKSGGR